MAVGYRHSVIFDNKLNLLAINLINLLTVIFSIGITRKGIILGSKLNIPVNVAFFGNKVQTNIDNKLYLLMDLGAVDVKAPLNTELYLKINLNSLST